MILFRFPRNYTGERFHTPGGANGANTCIVGTRNMDRLQDIISWVSGQQRSRKALTECSPFVSFERKKSLFASWLYHSRVHFDVNSPNLMHSFSVNLSIVRDIIPLEREVLFHHLSILSPVLQIICLTQTTVTIKKRTQSDENYLSGPWSSKVTFIFDEI